ncbi:MAG: hypothetical protein AAGI03_00300 [Pseudomonadota bacterium]
MVKSKIKKIAAFALASAASAVIGAAVLGLPDRYKAWKEQQLELQPVAQAEQVLSYAPRLNRFPRENINGFRSLHLTLRVYVRDYNNGKITKDDFDHIILKTEKRLLGLYHPVRRVCSRLDASQSELEQLELRTGVDLEEMKRDTEDYYSRSRCEDYSSPETS